MPVYLKDTFIAEISVVYKPEILNKFFEILQFKGKLISLFEQATAGWHERKALENLVTTQYTRPLLKTPSNILKQIAEIYTRTIFDIFQEEVVESLSYYVKDAMVSKYRVTRDEGAYASCTVSYDFL